jgi:hypothetical protein
MKQSYQCGWCLEVFSRERRALAEVEALRRVLMIPMTTPFDPPICDSCYAGVMSSAVPTLEVMGETPPATSLGFRNLALLSG